MADKENNRKCFKCGCTPAADKVKLFRFPKPGTRNLIRCEHWAKFIFPEKEASLTLQQKLHSEHRMLCQRHFKDVDFIDDSKLLLSRSAIPIPDELNSGLPKKNRNLSTSTTVTHNTDEVELT